jgi:hypothetical protein
MKVTKILTYICLLILTALFGCSFCRAQQPTEKLVPVQMTFEFLVVQLREDTARQMIPELRDRQRAAKTVDRISKLIADKKATLIGWPVLTTKSGMRAVVEQVDEVRYPTEFEAPSQLTTTEQYPPAEGTPGAPIVPVDPKEAPPEPPKPTHVTTINSISDGVPTTFDTRNAGVMLEIEATLAPDGKHIDVGLVPQHVRFFGMKKAEVEQKGTGKKTIVEQPQFATNKVTTNIVVQDGDYTLLGVFRVSESPDRLELFILHTQVDRSLLFPEPEDGHGILR